MDCTFGIITKNNLSNSRSQKFASMFVCAHSCPTLCGLMDCSPPGSSVRGIFQARILEWVAISTSRGSSLPRDQTESLISPALAGRFFTTGPTWKVLHFFSTYFIVWGVQGGNVEIFFFCICVYSCFYLPFAKRALFIHLSIKLTLFNCQKTVDYICVYLWTLIC